MQLLNKFFLLEVVKWKSKQRNDRNFKTKVIIFMKSEFEKNPRYFLGVFKLATINMYDGLYCINIIFH